MEQRELTLAPESVGLRLDRWLAEQCPDLSRSQLQNLIEAGSVTCNGSPLNKKDKLKAGQTILLTLPDPQPIEAQPQNIPLDIVYEDDSLLVVNKPKGMVVHPAAGHYTGTLVNGLMYHCKDELSGINGVMRPGIVHRIDMDTTGVIIACKNDMAHNSIAAQLKEHADEKAAQYREEAAAKIEAAKNVKAAMTANRNERIAAMNSRMTELTKKRQDMMKHMNFYRRSILRGNPSASSMKFAAALKELREATEKRNK